MGQGIALLAVLLAAAGAQGAPDASPAPTYRVPLPAADAAAARQLMTEWARAQNTLVWKQYADLYAAGFRGIRRSGTRTVMLDRKQWLAERARMFEKGGMSVDIVDPIYEGDGEGGVRVRFVQLWASGPYADRGSKVIVLRREDGGDFKIVREEMLDSEIDRSPIAPEKSEDADLVKIIYPNNAAATGDASAWTFTKQGDQSSTDTAFGKLRVVLWSETHNPHRHTQFDSEYFGGVAAIADGRLVGTRYGLEGLPASVDLIKARDSVILAIKLTSAFRGELFEVLEVYVLGKTGLRFKERAPVRMNDSGADDTYDCEAKIEIRDVNGNGIPDIVLRPVRLRHPKSCSGFPRVERRWLF
jgi:hypothetical protein